MFQQLQQVWTTALYPEVHRVARHQFWLVHLLQHLQLQARIDVGQKHKRRVTKLLWNLRSEIREDAEMRFECLGGIQIVAIPAAPAKAGPLRRFESGKIDAAGFERCEFLQRVIAANNAHQLHFREVRRG